MDKDIARRLVEKTGVLSIPYRMLSSRASADDTTDFCKRTAEEFGWPLFVKPCSLGSSVGIHKAKNMAELLVAVADARRFDDTVLVEAFIKGREIELAVLENIVLGAKPKVSVPGEICVHHPDGFYSYTAKYLESELTDLIVPARLSDTQVQEFQQAAAAIFVSLKCKGMARVDFLYDEERAALYFNEVNTLPGFTPISMYPKLWQASGLSYPALLDSLIELGLMHHRGRQDVLTHYQ
jgi:D-alanine-D-alanine ligase